MTNLNLSELTLDNIAEWPKPVKYGLSGLLAVIIIGFGYWFIVKPNLEIYYSLQKEEKKLRTDFEFKQSQAVNLQAYKNQLKLLRQRFGNMLAQLPGKHEMPGLLEDISKTGIASGLSFELFAPQSEIEHDFYIEMPIKIVVDGTYHQLAIFLSRIAQMSRIVTLHDFEIIKPIETGNEPSQNPSDALEMAITAKIYRYKIYEPN